MFFYFSHATRPRTLGNTLSSRKHQRVSSYNTSFYGNLPTASVIVQLLISNSNTCIKYNF